MYWSASGRRGAVADDARAREVGLRHSSCEAAEQRGAIRGGARGTKERGEGEDERGAGEEGAGGGAGKGVKGGGTDTASSEGKEEGKVHCALPPYQHRFARRGVLRAKARRSSGRR